MLLYKPHPLTWGNHDLVLVSPDSKEGEVVGGVKVPHSAPGLGSQLLNLAGILNSRGIVQCATNWDTFMGETKVERLYSMLIVKK